MVNLSSDCILFNSFCFTVYIWVIKMKNIELKIFINGDDFFLAESITKQQAIKIIKMLTSSDKYHDYYREELESVDKNDL